jgi:hypothetical protein
MTALQFLFCARDAEFPQLLPRARAIAMAIEKSWIIKAKQLSS